MATTSFNKDFIITDSKSIRQFRDDLQKPQIVTVKNRDHKKDKVKGICLLKQRLSNLETC